MARDITIVVLSVLFVALLIGTAVDVIHSSDRNKLVERDTVLRIGTLDYVDSLNPYLGTRLASHQFYGLVYDSLFSVDDDMNPVPNLALEAYVVPESDPSVAASGEPYGSVWQYNLTHNAHWHDGRPFTADDVVWNIWLSSNVSHYNAMWAYQPYSYFIMWAEKIDDYTVRIHFWDRASGESIPVSWGKSVSIPMLPKHLLEGFTYTYIGMNWSGVFNDTESPGAPIVGTGPFMATESIYKDWVGKDPITLVRNPNYHSKLDSGKEVHFDKLQMISYDESAAAVLALKLGQLDVVSLPPDAYDSVKNDIARGASRTSSLSAMGGPDPVGTSMQLIFNMRQSSPNPARLDVVVRQAIHQAINKSYIVDMISLGYAEEATTMISSSNPWHCNPSPSELLSYDIAAASALLESNGYVDTNGNGVRECTASSPAVQNGYVEEGRELWFSLGYFFRFAPQYDTAVHIQTQLDEIGIGLNLTRIDDLVIPSSYGWDLFYNQDALLEMSRSDVDPTYDLFQSSKKAWNGWSMNNYYNASFDEDFSLSVRELDSDIRREYVDDCQLIAYGDSASISLAYFNSTYAARNDSFVGWGDWLKHPGRNLDACWGANPLFFDLMPVAGAPLEPVNYGPVEVLYAGPAAIGVGVLIAGSLVAVRRKRQR